VNKHLEHVFEKTRRGNPHRFGAANLALNKIGEDGATVRIISARKATKRESAFYPGS
jgi:uncharacterized DUF497 family protein